MIGHPYSFLILGAQNMIKSAISKNSENSAPPQHVVFNYSQFLQQWVFSTLLKGSKGLFKGLYI